MDLNFRCPMIVSWTPANIRIQFPIARPPIPTADFRPVVRTLFVQLPLLELVQRPNRMTRRESIGSPPREKWFLFLASISGCSMLPSDPRYACASPSGSSSQSPAWGIATARYSEGVWHRGRKIWLALLSILWRSVFMRS
jgi:hypothetical protein